MLRPGDGTEEGNAQGAHAVETAGFERGVGFFEAKVGICGPVDFVPLQVARGFCGDVFVRELNQRLWARGDRFLQMVYLLSNLRRFWRIGTGSLFLTSPSRKRACTRS